MKFVNTKIIQGTVFLIALMLAACGGGSGGNSGVTGVDSVALPLYSYQMGGARQGAVLNLIPTVSTLADGTGAPATFSLGAVGITTDGSNLYVADTYNHKICKVDIATGVVTTLAGTGAMGSEDGAGAVATFQYPHGITTDGANLYVAGWGENKIRKIVIATGEVSTLAGTGAVGAADGAGQSATFRYPYDITTDGANLYVTDWFNYKIRKIVIATGVVSSVTGVANKASAQGSVDGISSRASFNKPMGITTDGSNLYVVDSGNNKIRKIVIATGVVSRLTGTDGTESAPGAADGFGSAATFNFPHSITTDGFNLYVTDTQNHKIRKIEIASRMVSSVTGVANTASVYGAADGPGSVATFYKPSGITTDGTNLFVLDAYNRRIRKIH